MAQVAIAVAAAVITRALFSDDGSTNQSEAAAQIQQDRADEMFDLWVNYYQPIELKALTEIANRVKYVPQFDAVMQRTNAQVLYDASRKRKQAMMCIPVRCEGMRRNVAKETATAQARIIAHAMQSAKMGEDAKAYIKDEQRLHDRMIINNIGMNINSRTDSALSAASALHQAAAARAQSAYYEGSKAVGQLVNRGVEWYKKPPAPEGFPDAEPYSDAAASSSGLPLEGSATSLSVEGSIGADAAAMTVPDAASSAASSAEFAASFAEFETVAAII